MRAGKLTRRIAIERETTTVDAAGTQRSAWAPRYQLAAEIVQSSTSEFLRSYGEEATAGIVFRMRFRPDISTADRVIHDGRAFNIVETREIGRRRIIELRCEART